MTLITKEWVKENADDYEESSPEIYNSNYNWYAYLGHIRIKGLNGNITVTLSIAGGITILPHIKTIEQVKLLESLLSDKPPQILTDAEILANLMKRGDEQNEQGLPVITTVDNPNEKGFCTYIRYDAVLKEINKQFKWRKKKYQKP